MSAKNIKLRFKPYTLELKHAFGVASNTRHTTPVVLTELEWDGIVGYGEASLPPYLGQTQDAVMQFLARLQLEQFTDPFLIEDILTYVDAAAPGHNAAKASIDIALHDLTGRLMGIPWGRAWGYNPLKTPHTSYTIGIDTPEIMEQKVKEATGFKFLKVKLGRDNDRQIMQTIRSVTDVPLYVDVNQGWTDKYKALDMLNWLHSQNVVLAEQPMPVDQIDDMAWLTAQSPIPTIADESVQRLPDIVKQKDVFNGINIKLMKSTGLHEAHRMIELAKALNMSVMLGCMTETSCAITAAAQLSPAVHYADLDGALLIKNDPFYGMQVLDGKIVLPNIPGVGIKKFE